MCFRFYNTVYSIENWSLNMVRSKFAWLPKFKNKKANEMTKCCFVNQKFNEMKHRNKSECFLFVFKSKHYTIRSKNENNL